MRASGLRSEVMVTTKVQPTLLAPHDLERSVKESLARLQLDVIDLLLIHWPNPRVPLAETLGAMAKMKREGYTRQIGVSNFTVALLEEANKISTEPLVCNQIECHPFLNQDKVIAACRKHGMAVVAYSPIARGGAHGRRAARTIGKAHGKSAAQVCLRWLVQQGIVVIPRTSKIERLEENFALFDFELSDCRDARDRRACAPRRTYRRLDLVAEVGLRAVLRRDPRNRYGPCPFLRRAGLRPSASPGRSNASPASKQSASITASATPSSSTCARGLRDGMAALKRRLEGAPRRRPSHQARRACRHFRHARSPAKPPSSSPTVACRPPSCPAAI